MNMSVVTSLWIWIKRFRKRKGYGVHSPFAFQLITQVINQKTPYYAFDGLKKLRKLTPKGVKCNSVKMDKFLFRLVNDSQPSTIIDYGTGAGITACYMKSAKKKSEMVSVDAESSETAAHVLKAYSVDYRTGDMFSLAKGLLNEWGSVGFVRIASVPSAWEMVDAVVSCASERTVMVIEGIYSDKSVTEKWHRLQDDERVGITFDLYDAGIVYFDHKLNKQHYIVNFV